MTATANSAPAADVDGVVGLAECVSACPNGQVRAGARLDPFWDGVWIAGSRGEWVSADAARRQQQAGLSRPGSWLLPETDGWQQVFCTRGWVDRLRFLAVVDGWRTVSAEQAQAMSGFAPCRRRRSGDRAAAGLFSAGLVDIGVFGGPLRRDGGGAARADMFRPAVTPAFTDGLQPWLTWPEWVAVTGGQPWRPTSTFQSRHNLLATELGLRLLELCGPTTPADSPVAGRVGTVLGENLSRHDLLTAGSPASVDDVADVDGDMGRAADACVVRPDGLRAAIEVTATTSARFADKVDRWARLLSSHRLADCGLVVVFLTAEPADVRAGAGRVHAETVKQVAAAVDRHPGRPGDRTADRMLVADWADWFPARHQVADGFWPGHARAPSGPPDDQWRPADVWPGPDSDHPVGFAPADPAAAEAVAAQAGWLAQVPWWARPTGQVAPLWRVELDRAGGDIPWPPPSRPDKTTGRRLGEGVGRGGDAQAPSRLLGV